MLSRSLSSGIHCVVRRLEKRNLLAEETWSVALKLAVGLLVPSSLPLGISYHEVLQHLSHWVITQGSTTVSSFPSQADITNLSWTP